MAVSYSLPAERAWSRMVRMLFRPFRFETWFVVGFAAFLSGHIPSFSGGKSTVVRHGSRPDLPAAARHAAAFLLHPVWGILALAIVTALAIGILIFMWLSSRGKFIFLDNVARERAAIVEPWKRYACHGNSLFVFRLVFIFLAGSIAIAISLPLLPAVLRAIASGEGWQWLTAILVVWWLAAMLPFVLVAACAALFLNQFVIPIMYRDDLGVLAAWKRFFSLFGHHKLSFLAYALLYLLVTIVVGVAVLSAGLLTCCVGFLLLAIPYVGSVVLLPVEVTFRGLGPDFLAQFGAEWSIYEKTQAAPPTLPGPGAGA